MNIKDAQKQLITKMCLKHLSLADITTIISLQKSMKHLPRIEKQPLEINV